MFATMKECDASGSPCFSWFLPNAMYASMTLSGSSAFSNIRAARLRISVSCLGGRLCAVSR